jgi:hypothetical protein
MASKPAADGSSPRIRPAIAKGGRAAPKPVRFLADQLPAMMYGFGDVENPLQSTVDTIEDVVVSYIQQLVRGAMSVGSQGHLSEQSLLMQVRRNPRKYHRARDLLTKWEEIKKVRAIPPHRCIVRTGFGRASEARPVVSRPSRMTSRSMGSGCDGSQEIPISPLTHDTAE